MTEKTLGDLLDEMETAAYAYNEAQIPARSAAVTAARSAIHNYVAQRVEEERKECAKIAHGLDDDGRLVIEERVGGFIAAEEIEKDILARPTEPVEDEG